MKTLPLTTKYVCDCPKPNLVVEYAEWLKWLQNHRKVCKPRRIVDLHLPESEDENDGTR